jgi:hypothetical protein
VSKQTLAKQAVERTPARSVIVGDGNFGIFSFAYAVVESGREALFRLKKARAQALGANDCCLPGSAGSAGSRAASSAGNILNYLPMRPLRAA